MLDTPKPPRPSFWRRKSFWYYSVLGAFLWHMVVYDYGMYFLTMWQSKPYNEKIEKMIAEGRTELPLKEIYDDFEWDTPCNVTGVGGLLDNAAGCILNDAGLPARAKQQRLAASAGYSIEPADFEFVFFVRDDTILLLIDQRNKLVHVRTTKPNIRSTDIIEGMTEPPFIEVRERDNLRIQQGR